MRPDVAFYDRGGGVHRILCVMATDIAVFLVDRRRRCRHRQPQPPQRQSGGVHVKLFFSLPLLQLGGLLPRARVGM